MDTLLTLLVNGKERTLEGLGSATTLDAVLHAMNLRADRIAVELNGELAPRTGWSAQTVRNGDRLEVVHFVGGGCEAREVAKSCLSRASHRSPYCVQPPISRTR